MRPNNKDVPVALALALAVALLTGCAQGQGAGGTTAAGTEPVQVTEANAPADQAEEDEATFTTEAAAVYEQRMLLACQFVATLHTNAWYDEYDDSEMGMRDDWRDQCLAFVAPESDLYNEFLSFDDQTGPGVVWAAEVVKGAWVVSASPYTYTVRALVVSTQDGAEGWTEQEGTEVYHTVTFDQNNWVVKLDGWGTA